MLKASFPRNPYTVSNPDLLGSSIQLLDLEEDLRLELLASIEPQCLQIIAERHCGTQRTVSQLLKRKEFKKCFVSVELDISREIPSPANIADFYRALVNVTSRILSETLPESAHQLAAEIDNKALHLELSELRRLVINFFATITLPGRRLLLALYFLDDLPCHLEVADWTLLRGLHNAEDKKSVLFVVVARQEIGQMECPEYIEQSVFAPIFAPPQRASLLSEDEVSVIAAELIAVGEQKLGKKIMEWSGGHPYALAPICAYLYQQLCQHQIPYATILEREIKNKLAQKLEDCFKRLVKNLQNPNTKPYRKDLLTPLIQTLQRGFMEECRGQIKALIDLGYLLPGPEYAVVKQDSYKPFSPLFHEFLINHGYLEKENKLPPVRNKGWPAHEPLSEAEFKVLKLLCDGLSNPEIAKALNLGVNTIKTHLQNIYVKLGIDGSSAPRTKAIKIAQEENVF